MTEILDMVNNQKLILICGASGSGKTSIAKELETKGYNIIQSYTSRKPREENEWGHTFVPVEEWIHNWSLSRDIIAFKELYGEAYWATKEQYKGKGTSIYIVDPDGAKQVVECVKDIPIITIYLTVDRSNRYDRLYDRDKLTSEVWSRLNTDDDLFQTVKCDYVVDANGDLESVVKLVLDILEEE